MKRIIWIAIIVLVGIYTEAQLIGVKNALRDIAAALQGNARIVVMQPKSPQKRIPTVLVGVEEL